MTSLSSFNGALDLLDASSKDILEGGTTAKENVLPFLGCLDHWLVTPPHHLSVFLLLVEVGGKPNVGT